MHVLNKTKKDMSKVVKLLQNFYPFAKNRLSFEKDATVIFVSDESNAKNPLGKTAYYDPQKFEIAVFVDDRHPKDILRSISHELIHHDQNCRGEFDKNLSTFEGYAQKNPHLRKMEEEAYMLGSGMFFRDWEDHYKMSENLIQEWKKDIKEKKVLKEGKKVKHDCASHVKENSSGREGVVVSHSLLEDGTVNFYTVDFGDEIVEDINVSELTVLEMREHMHAKRDEPKAKEDYDEDGELETPSEEYLGSRDKAIKKAMKKRALEEAYSSRHSKLYEGLMKKFIK